MTAPQPFGPWLDRFLLSYYRHRPVNATFIGVHDHDHRLPDFSDSGVGDADADARSLLADARRIDPGFLSLPERADLRLASGFLEIQRWEFQSRHFHRGNPSLYTGESLFGVMSLFLTDFAPIAERTAAATARLDEFGPFLAQARANVPEAPAEWTERAIRECRGGLAFLVRGVEHLARTPGANWKAFLAAASRAAGHLRNHQHHLETETLRRPAAMAAAGPAALDLYLRQGHCLAETADEIAEHAEAELEKARRYLTERAADAVAAPGTAGTDPRYQAVWEDARDTALRHQLLTWADFPIRYVPRPAWAAEAAPDLYFLCYRSPSAFGRPPVHEYLVPPDDPGESAVKLNHVVHHGGIGHHVQNWHAFRARSRIGQVAAVDCASRIAMFCGGTMAEGWACYATDLLGETGYLTNAERYDEQRTRARMCARAVVDVRLHQGRYSLADAAACYQREADMPAEAARAEAAKNSMFPGTALMYVAGTDRIHRLRQALTTRLGGRFSLKAFHDEFLSHGSIPVALIEETMMEQADGAE